ncbi:phage tail tube protein [[Mycoplasma] gypis]|uniref:Uncharacterized protein n=1 Tax=[Mycoplasma] gypis TaxID=92404 RepID=A0ABZ2RQV2_9BACT|nr:hypothetical protein [[Mycoplasma] gypis]MBN0919432.1 hypothetical protein [[Mycoplasma] gypis]
MIKTNNGNKLYIATYPEPSTTPETADYKLLNFVTDFKFNYSVKKEDRTYFHNNGLTTSLITGGSQSLSVSVDYDADDQLHQYLVYLLTNDPTKSNNQFIKIEFNDEIKRTTSAVSLNEKGLILKGKAVLLFKNSIPNGSANEIIKLQFDILPQDNKWDITKA